MRLHPPASHVRPPPIPEEELPGETAGGRELAALRDAMGGRLSPLGLQMMQRALGNQEVLRAMRDASAPPIASAPGLRACPVDPELDATTCPLDPSEMLPEPADTGVCPVRPDDMDPTPFLLTCDTRPDTRTSPNGLLLSVCEQSTEVEPVAMTCEPAHLEPEYPGDAYRPKDIEVKPFGLQENVWNITGPDDFPWCDALAVHQLVEIYHRPWSPLFGPQGSVRDEDLYRFIDEDEACAGDVEWLSFMLGHANCPWTERELDLTTPFIRGRPTPADVAQGYVGTCWLLAAAASLAATDPASLLDVFEMRRDTAIVHLWHDDHGAPVRVSIPVSLSFPMFSTDDWPSGLAVANVRTGPGPIRSAWSVAMEGYQGRVRRLDTYEAATWVVLLEKAAAILASLDAGVVLSYEKVHGGWPDRAMFAILGPKVAARELPDLGDAEISGEDIDPRISVWLSALAQVGSVREGDPTARCVLAVSALGIRAALQLIAEAPGGDAQPVVDAARVWLANKDKASHALVADAALRWLQLHPGTAGTGDQRLGRLIRTLAQKDDRPTPDSWVLTPHAYSVLAAQLITTAGTPWHDGEAIDLDRSLVVLRNPHGRGEPAELGGADDGVFTLTVAELLDVFDAVSVATVVPAQR